MEVMFRVHEFIFLIYLASLSVLLYDLVFRDRVARKVSFYLALLAGLFHIISFFAIAIYIGRIPVMTTYEGMFALSMILIIVGIIHYEKTDSEIAFFVYLLSSFILFSVFTFAPVTFDREVQVSGIMNELLFIHISLALLSYVLFFVSMLHAMIYIIQHGNLKKKRFNRLFFSLFSVETAKKIMIRTLFFGLVFMLISILLGIQWGIYIIGMEIFMDVKVLGTLFVLVFYTIILSRYKISGKLYEFAWLNILVFVLCMLNYLFITQLSDFHFWSG